MKFKELKSKSEKELQRLLTDTRHDLQELQFKVHANQLKNLREVREAKKTIARVLMLLGQTKGKAKEEIK
ncbi:MAG: 50S ribosomal protein L29 [Patescibacteria group bacterium]|nr:50S ribosomal protein L29 [Patescibacteria group bacterium]